MARARCPFAIWMALISPLAEGARVAASIARFLFGDSVYEVVPAYESRPVFALREHLDRLNRSLAGIRMAAPPVARPTGRGCVRS